MAARKPVTKVSQAIRVYRAAVLTLRDPERTNRREEAALSALTEAIATAERAAHARGFQEGQREALGS